MDKKTFINCVTTDLLYKKVSLFAGAGVSIHAGFPTWEQLLAPCFKDLNLQAKEGVDLLDVAQKYEDRHSRKSLNNILLDAIDNNLIRLGSNNLSVLLSFLPFGNIWTTNYDNVLENSFNKNDVDFQKIFNSESFSATLKHKKMRIIKLNGDISSPSSIIITRNDLKKYSSEKK